MGEFKKRLKKGEMKVPVAVEYDDGAKVETAVFYNAFKVDRIIEEAKKEFPAFHQNYWKRTKEKSELITWDKTVKKWFEKWFGSDEKKTS